MEDDFNFNNHSKNINKKMKFIEDSRNIKLFMNNYSKKLMIWNPFKIS